MPSRHRTGASLRRVDTVVIPRRFNGPPDSANGGYAAGLLGRALPGVSEVTLRTPPPLETPLEVRLAGSGAVLTAPDGAPVAEARPGALDDVEPPVRPTPDAAERAAARHLGRGLRHALSDCVVCGPERADGFRLCTGPLDDLPEVGAAVFHPDPTLAGPDGDLPPQILWAALDCPGFTPGMWQRYLGTNTLTLLGRLTASLERPAPASAPLVAVGWHLATDGRKHHTASALLTTSGEVVARAKATWIELKHP
jgi:hypothetical protein